MHRVTHNLSIPETDLSWDFCLSSGPGGQHANTSATAVSLRFDLSGNESLPGHIKDRVARLAGKRLTEDGVILIQANRYRSQKRNRDEALERLIDLVRRAAAPVRRRRPTKPTRGARERRLKAKKRRGDLKKLRRPPRTD